MLTSNSNQFSFVIGVNLSTCSSLLVDLGLLDLLLPFVLKDLVDPGFHILTGHDLDERVSLNVSGNVVEAILDTIHLKVIKLRQVISDPNSQ